MTLQHVRRGMAYAVMIPLLSVIAACSSLTKPDTEAAQKLTREKVEARVNAADAALQQGQTQQAMEQLEQAIKIDPSAKQPWVRKAQIRFEAREYGYAINDAKEVLQRDVNDLTAQSILAVSGLRVSAEALAHLRNVDGVKGTTRSEAENVAKLIRESLGEPILVAPQPDVMPPVAGRSRRSVVRSVAKPALQASPAVAATRSPVTAPARVSPAAVPAKPTPAPAGKAAVVSGGRNNPFGALQ